MHQVFVLTPFKLVTGHFLSKYLECRSDLSQNNTQIHYQIAFQLMMSLDLSFEELMNIIQKPLTLRNPDDDTGDSYITETLDKDFLTQFRLGLSNLTQLGSLSSFIDRIDYTKDATDKEWAEMMRKHCHPKSMIGMFLRRIVIHFKRLSFNETAMLVRNLSSYIRYGEPVPETPGSKSEENFKFPELKTVPIPGATDDSAAKVSMESLKAIEKKLIREHRSIDVQNDRRREVKVRHQIFVLSKLIKDREMAVKKDTSATAMTLGDEPSEVKGQTDESSLQLDDAWDQSSKAKAPEIDPKDTSGDSDDRDAPAVTQQYLIHQVNMIMNNEKRSLAPESILRLVEHFYKKHYLFQYQQSIHSNYRMNVRMNSRNTQLDSASSMTNSDNQDGNDITNIFSKNFGHVQSTNNFHNDLNYLKFINALRMNDYPLAQETLHLYFDNKDFSFSQGLTDPFGNKHHGLLKKKGSDGPEVTNNCWALLNIGIMHAHFGHYELAYETLEDCVRIARDSNENKCLQYEMIWMLHVLEQLDRPQSTHAVSSRLRSKFRKLFAAIFDDINKKDSKLLVEEYSTTATLMKLIHMNERKLPYVAAMGLLHLEKQLYRKRIRCSELRQPLGKVLSVEQQLKGEYLRPPFNIKPMLLASRYMMDDVLQKQYSIHSAMLNAFGAHHLAAVTSKLVARMDFSGVLQEQKFAHCNENHAIAFRNIAFYQWKVGGDHRCAMKMLKFFHGYISKYDKRMLAIVGAAMLDIEFDVAANKRQWKTAEKLAARMAKYDGHAAAIMRARLEMAKGDNRRGKEILLTIVADEQLARVSQNVQHNEALMKNFKKAKTTIKVSEPGLKPMPKINLNAKGPKRFSLVSDKRPKTKPKKKQNPDTRIMQKPGENLAVISAETDPFLWIYGRLLIAKTGNDWKGFFDVIEAAQSYGFRQLEIKAELELIRIQQEEFRQFKESQGRLDDLIVKVIASGIQEDIAQAYLLTARNHCSIQKAGNYHKCQPDAEGLAKLKARLAKEMPLQMTLYPEFDARSYHLLIARRAVLRATVIYSKLQDHSGVLKCIELGSVVERMLVEFYGLLEDSEKDSGKDATKERIIAGKEAFLWMEFFESARIAIECVDIEEIIEMILV